MEQNTTLYNVHTSQHIYLVYSDLFRKYFTLIHFRTKVNAAQDSLHGLIVVNLSICQPRKTKFITELCK